jgi:hypothetical protein
MRRTVRKKRRTRAHVIADLSVNWVERCVLCCGFSAERVAHDYGIDLLMFTYSAEGEIENGHVEFQLKATDHPAVHADGRTISFSVQVADLKLWLYQPMPVILIVYDAPRNRAFWLHVQRYKGIQEVPDKARDTVTVHIPTGNRVGVRAVRKFRAFKEAVLAQVKGAYQDGE